MKETNKVEDFLGDLADGLEPKTHCCECTPGANFQRHGVHIQYTDCLCKEKDFVLKRN